MLNKLQEVKDWYEENERRISTFSLAGGFVFDSLTLQRIDSLIDNLWLGVNLLSILVCLFLINREENTGSDDSWKHFWLFNILQFSFGALLGASFIFYFRSAELAVSWPFLAILLAAMIANEVLKKHYERLIFQISFLYLALYVFSIFLVPILIHRIGPVVFLTSGLLSLLVLWLFVWILGVYSKERFRKSLKHIRLSVLGIFAVINLLYFTNILPPIPLSLKDSGIYHSVVKNADGSYTVSEEHKLGIGRYISFRQSVRLPRGDNLFAYSAIYSPADLDTNIVHEWQYYDKEKKSWITSTKIPLKLSGGRAEGFRTYSAKASLSSGRWRVNVATPRGQIIGRINFNLELVNTSPALETSIKR